MKKILFPILALILLACSPQVTLTSQVTVTVAPPEILIPTPTLHPQYTQLQEQISQSPIYTLTPNGFEMKNEDGTITPVPNIKPNITAEALTFTITYEGKEFITKFDSIEEKQLAFTGEDERKWVWNGNSLVHSYFEDELAQMTPEQKLQASPEIKGLVKSNISTVKAELAIYRDEAGNAIKVFNLLTAQELSPTDAGIIEIIMKDGGKIEMLSFETPENALDYMINIDGVTYAVQSIGSIEGATPFFDKLFKIPSLGNNVMGGVAVSITSLDTYIRIMVYNAGAGTVFVYVDDEGVLKSIHVNGDAEEIKSRLLAGSYPISIKNLTP